MCDSGVGKDVAQFLVGCGEFERSADAVGLCVQNCGV